MKKITSLILALILCAGLVSCGQNGGTGGGDDKEIIFGATTYFGASDLDPAESYNGWYLSFDGAGETLFKLDKGFNAIPWLVKSYTAPTDGVTWTFELRDDVYFHNGEKMTAEAVKKSFEYMLEHNSRGPETFHFASIEANGQTLTIVTSSPTPALITDLCDPIGVVQYIADGMDYATESYMTGPFMVTEFVPNEYMYLERFEEYWGGAAKVKKISLMNYGDQDSLAMALQSGEIDMAVMPDNASLALFSDESKYAFSSAVSTRCEALAINLARPFGADITVRKALGYCIDRDGFAQSMNGVYAANYALFPDTMTYGGTDGLVLPVDRFDIEEAKRILAEAGYADTDGDGFVEKDGEKLTLKFVYTGNYNEKVKFVEMFASDAAKAGIDVQLESYGKTNDVVASGDYDLQIIGVGMAPTGNPQYFMNTRWKTGSSSNQGYSNPALDELAEKLEATFDPAERDRITLQIEQLVLDDLFFQVYANKQFYCVYTTEITGFEAQPSEYYLVDNLIDINRK